MKSTPLSFLLFLWVPCLYAAEHIVLATGDIAEGEMYFEPKSITVGVGDTVKWVNNQDLFHNIMATKDGVPENAKPFKSAPLYNKNDSWSHTFDVPGDYEYFCLPHKIMGMVGTVHVKAK